MTSLVVKLGGSNAASLELDLWLSTLAGSGQPIVIVPGGGPFADFIRESQPKLGFSDKAAHAMAILAMEQFGHLLLDRRPDLAIARTLDELKNAACRKRPVLWTPVSLALDANDIAVSWEVTSDSLAAWLAGQLGCSALLLVKQIDVEPGSVVEDLAEIGIVDPVLPSMLPSNVELHIAGPAAAAGAAAELAAGRVPGVRIERHAAMRKTG